MKYKVLLVLLFVLSFVFSCSFDNFYIESVTCSWTDPFLTAEISDVNLQMPDGYDFVFPQDSINSFGSFFDLMLGSNQRIDFNIENQKCDNHKEETFVFTTDDLDKVDFSPSSLKYIAYVDSPSYMNFIRFKFKFSVEKVEAEDSYGHLHVGRIEWFVEDSQERLGVGYFPKNQLLHIPNLYSKGKFISENYYYMPIYYSGVFVNN